MSTAYHRFAGRSQDRVQALSDGVFAIATTLLVLDLRVPIVAAHTDRALWSALADLGPGFAAFVLSFTMLGTFWLAQHTLLGMCQRGDRTLSWLQLGFLIPVTLLPFSASLLAEFVTVRSAVGLYWLNIALLGLGLATSTRHITRAGLLNEDDNSFGRLRIFRRRILVAQIGYAAAALLCLANTYLSVGALALVQAYFIAAPHLPLLDRLLLEPIDLPERGLHLDTPMSGSAANAICAKAGRDVPRRGWAVGSGLRLRAWAPDGFARPCEATDR